MDHNHQEISDCRLALWKDKNNISCIQETPKGNGGVDRIVQHIKCLDGIE